MNIEQADDSTGFYMIVIRIRTPIATACPEGIGLLSVKVDVQSSVV
jgi:hypothetical protein